MPMPQTKTDPLLRNKLITVLSFLKHKAEDKGLEPVISVKKLIDLLGIHITYSQLAELTKDPSISHEIKSINKNQVTLSLGEEEIPMAVPDEFSPNDFENEPSDEVPEESEEEFNPEDFQAPDEGESASADTSDEDQEREDVSISSGGLVQSMAKRAAYRK